MNSCEGNQMENEQQSQDWRELHESEWADLLEQIDPDWTDHFPDAEIGLNFYSKYDSDTVTNAVQEYNQ